MTSEGVHEMHVTPVPQTTIDDVLHDMRRGSREALAPFIETLERAVLNAWEDSDELGDVSCGVCLEFASPLGAGHAPDCIVPALIEKYADD